MLYNNLSGYLRNKYGTRVKKICIDGGFSCPNRDGVCGVGGCIFCGERGAGEHIDPTPSIREQAEAVLSRAGASDRFIAYFQNFTNTYAEPEVLKERYSAALFDKRVVCLAIGTRPDCITREVARLIASYKDRVDVWVELGLQTASDKTARLINRGYKTEVFENAVGLLSEYGIPVVVHIMLGLPGEGRAEALQTVRTVNKADVFGVKLHSVYVMENTRLASMYREGVYTPISFKEYTELAAECIARLSPSVILHRITGDCPEGLLVAPEWNRDKNATIEGIRSVLTENGWTQGSLYNK